MVGNSAAMLPKVRSNLPPENVNSGTAKTREGVRERGLEADDGHQDDRLLQDVLCTLPALVSLSPDSPTQMLRHSFLILKSLMGFLVLSLVPSTILEYF